MVHLYGWFLNNVFINNTTLAICAKLSLTVECDPHKKPMQWEIDQPSANGHFVIITKRTILILYMQLDQTIGYAVVYLVLLSPKYCWFKRVLFCWNTLFVIDMTHIFDTLLHRLWFDWQNIWYHAQSDSHCI